MAQDTNRTNRSHETLDSAREPRITAEHGTDTGSNPAAPLTIRIERLALEERIAIRARDWTAARRRAVERAALQESRQRMLARRCSGRHE